MIEARGTRKIHTAGRKKMDDETTRTCELALQSTYTSHTTNNKKR